ncbi:hypothetical protein NPIL_572051 [Nephila pilipes]|uniref:Uncharacterized protein n=1 Tax=Nephila pilipes TaxID=299642 RepID=A0A8X6MY25_NEPPI|nr:hypothetical protein NPIL_572051 [Nephila pilipes]
MHPPSQRKRCRWSIITIVCFLLLRQTIHPTLSILTPGFVCCVLLVGVLYLRFGVVVFIFFVHSGNSKCPLFAERLSGVHVPWSPRTL